MSIDSKEDLDGILAVGRLVADTMRHMVTSIRAGMTTLELDQIGRRYFEERGGRSAPELTYLFPGATCIGVNEEAAHGIPGSRILEKGDVINVDSRIERVFRRHGLYYIYRTRLCRYAAPYRYEPLCA